MGRNKRQANPQNIQDANARLQQIKYDNDTAAAIRRHEPIIGMTRAQLDSAMGAPDRVNAANYSGVQQDQLIYYRQNATWYVYTKAGRVDSIQRSDPMRHMAPATHNRRCPTSSEIRDAEVSASSLSLSPQERAQRAQAIADMRACRR